MLLARYSQPGTEQPMSIECVFSWESSSAMLENSLLQVASLHAKVIECVSSWESSSAMLENSLLQVGLLHAKAIKGCISLVFEGKTCAIFFFFVSTSLAPSHVNRLSRAMGFFERCP